MIESGVAVATDEREAARGHLQHIAFLIDTGIREASTRERPSGR
jgi:hypothetical protein